MKLIQVTEAANRLGVHRQTLENWGERGLLNIRKVGKAHYVDEDTIIAMSDSSVDVKKAQKAIDELKLQLQETEKELEQRVQKIRQDLRLTKTVGAYCATLDFYLAIPNMLFSLGVIKLRECEVIRDIIKGYTFNEMVDRFGVSRERLRQIFYKAIRKAGLMTGIKERLDGLQQLQEENIELKRSMAVMARDLKVQQEAEWALKQKEEAELIDYIKKTDDLLKLYNSRITDYDLSVRLLNCLKSANCETIGEICKHFKTDFLKIRCFGKRSLGELVDFIEGLGLSFGVDTDQVYRDRIAMRMQEMKPENS